MASTERPATPFSHHSSEQQNDRVVNSSKRLTLAFPVVPPSSRLESNRPPSPGQAASSATSARSWPSWLAVPGSPTDSSTFLTSLAAQERRVLELREELQKAEADLSRLKKQWARHEAGRKKGAIRQLEPLQSITAPPSARFGGHGDGTIQAPACRASIEAGRNRPVVRKSTQRVFSGSRHTRALSLLSPDATNHQSSHPRAPQGVLSPTVTTTDVHSEQSPFLKSTFSRDGPDVGFGRTYKRLAERNSAPPPAKDAFMTSGKRVAADLREGLWTFFDDIRQATVGEEGINGPETGVAGPRRLGRQGTRHLQETDQASNRARGGSQSIATSKEWQDTRFPYRESRAGLDDQAIASPHM